jgi:DNA-binding NarL/FixJ family response regulator
MTSHANATRKHIIVVSDSDRLSRAIRVNLERRLGAQIVSINSYAARLRDSRDPDGCDLVIVALSSPASEPIVVLSRASLASRVGQVPLLIISDHPFDPDPECQIQHLDFPFSVDQLCYAVSATLSLECAPLERPLCSVVEEAST